MDRPLGIMIIALLVLINGIVALLEAVFAFAASLPLFPATLALLFGLALLYLAYGIWALRSWAWFATLLIVGLNAAFALVLAVTAPGALGPIITLILAGVIIFYLTRQDVRRAFGRAVGT
jgi:hypothetical protein